MSDQQPDEPRKDWMENWYETGEIPSQIDESAHRRRQPPGPLSPEAEARLLAYFQELTEQQERERGDE